MRYGIKLLLALIFGRGCGELVGDDGEVGKEEERWTVLKLLFLRHYQVPPFLCFPKTRSSSLTSLLLYSTHSSRFLSSHIIHGCMDGYRAMDFTRYEESK